MKTLACAQCGEVFLQRMARQKFCSRRCCVQKKDRIRRANPAWREKRLERDRIWRANPAYQERNKERGRNRERKRSAIIAAIKELGLINMGDLK